MGYDPLARFRRRQEPEQGLEQAPVYEPAEAPDEHRALRAAIDALHQIPDTPLSGDYKSTHALLPVLETVYQNTERELEQQRAITPMTDAEIDAAVEHDINLFEEIRQDWQEEPIMTDAEMQKGARGWDRLAQSVAEEQGKQREQDREPDIEPEM